MGVLSGILRVVMRCVLRGFMRVSMDFSRFNEYKFFFFVEVFLWNFGEYSSKFWAILAPVLYHECL